MFASMPKFFVLEAVWKSIGTELVIFVVTLAFALAIRTLNDSRKLSVKTMASSEPIKVVQAESECPLKPQGFAPTQAQRRGRRAPASILDEIVGGMKEQPSLRGAMRALQLYHEDLRPLLHADGLTLQEISRFSKNSPAELFTTLVHCAIRAGRYHVVEGLLDDMVDHKVHRSLTFYESAMKQLAGQKQYHLALAVHDRLEADGLRPSSVTCSCLIGFAAEVGELQRAVDFFEKLAETSTPSIRAYMTVLRVHAKRQDFKASADILRDMDKRNVGLDSLALNVVLRTGVAADQLEAVAALVAEADQRSPPISDVVSYNTLMKGYAQRGNAAAATEVIGQMKARGLSPNAITFNTAMDAAVRGGDATVAWKLLADMQAAGVRPDKFTCSIMIKGLARSPTVSQVRDAMALLKDVDSSCDQTLKSTLYHALLDQAARTTGPGGGVALQAQAFAQMRAAKITASPAAQRQMMNALPSMGSGKTGL